MTSPGKNGKTLAEIPYIKTEKKLLPLIPSVTTETAFVFTIQ